MTKDEMLAKYSPHKGENNYREAQKRIKEAMENGEKYVYLPGKNSRGDFSWCATSETISRLTSGISFATRCLYCSPARRHTEPAMS